MLNFPTNPTGAVAPVETLQEIARICIKHDLMVLTDEIYSELRYDGKPHVSIASLPGMKERTLLLHGFSKAFAMTGFRLGYACGPEPLISAMMKIHQYSMLCAPITSQEAAIEALENGTSAMLKMRESYRQRRNWHGLPPARRCVLCLPGHFQIWLDQQGVCHPAADGEAGGRRAGDCLRREWRRLPALLLCDRL